jgi:hypothetical protein
VTEKPGFWAIVLYPQTPNLWDTFCDDDLVVLPQSRQFWDSPIMLTKAVNLLAEIEERSPNEILLTIQQEDDVKSFISVTKN